ncbi:hypothetical protein IE53DRAFT_384137 [Violaceomyces palustris]|uniref:Uncharacterized protein n=1 Tax=Violaceomyces palustris TaxID=1673888 RepID=A0ACD0P5Q1_9BASI|nr:hypothetical protein IE53DRAFT_384137 [Violaceomyces palustris]
MPVNNQPNTSIYVKNINTKIKKPELRRQLYSLFATYGKVLDVVATRAEGMRGQAFVVFKDLQSATAAMRGLDGFEFYDKPLSIDYAKSKSKATLVEELGPEALFDPSLLASEKGKTPGPGKVTLSSAQAEARGREKKRAREEAGAHGELDSDEDADQTTRGTKAAKTGDGEGREEKEEDDDEEDAMEMGDDSDEEQGPMPAPGTLYDPNSPPLPEVGEVPNPVLFCPDLPSEISEDMLGVLFQQWVISAEPIETQVHPSDSLILFLFLSHSCKNLDLTSIRCSLPSPLARSDIPDSRA